MFVKVLNKRSGEVEIKKFKSMYKLQKYVYGINIFDSTTREIIEINFDKGGDKSEPK